MFYTATGLLAGYLFWLIRLRSGWRKLSWQEPETGDAIPFTVLIPARNEGGTLPALLRDLARQQYPLHALEIIVVDDHSEDSTPQVARSFRGIALECLQLPEGKRGKKEALDKGIAAAANPWVFTLDADVRISPDWAAAMASRITEGVNLICGPVACMQQRGFLSAFQQLDFLGLQFVTAGTFGNGKPVSCNGANLGIRKEAFHAVGGYKGNRHLSSGDDVFLLQKMESEFPGSTRFVKHPAAMAWVQPLASWPAFFRQRMRWAGKSIYYPDRKTLLLLVAVYLLNVSLLLSIWEGWFSGHWLWVGALWGAKLLAEGMFLYPPARFYDCAKTFRWFLPVGLLHVPYTVLVGFLGIFIPVTWKGRRSR